MNNKAHLVLATTARSDIEQLSIAIVKAQWGAVGLYITGLDDRLDDLLNELCELRAKLEANHALEFAPQDDREKTA